MTAPVRSTSRSAGLWCALAGLHAGMLSGLAALAWHMSLSALSGGGATRTLLALAAAFYRSPGAVHNGWRMFLAGAAVHLVAAGLLGAVFGMATAQVKSFRRRLLLGILFGVLWYHGWFLLLAPPARFEFYSSTGLLAGHLLFGAILGALRPIPHSWREAAEELPGGPPDGRPSGMSSL